MANILINPEKLTDRVIVEYSPEEILIKNIYVSNKEEDAMHTDAKIANAIQNVAWRDLCINAPQIKKRKFKYGNTQVIGGKFVVTFFEGKPEITHPPGEKK